MLSSLAIFLVLVIQHCLNTVDDCVGVKSRSGDMFWQSEEWAEAEVLSCYNKLVVAAKAALMTGWRCFSVSSIPSDSFSRFSFTPHVQSSVQLPPATRAPANLRPTQPPPADVPEWTLRWRGHGGREGRVTQQREKKLASRPLPLDL